MHKKSERKRTHINECLEVKRENYTDIKTEINT